MTKPASKFFAWFDGVNAAAVASPIGQLLTPLGYTVGHTGGGCLAWQKKDEATGWCIMICDEENGLGTDIAKDAAEFLVGLHHDDGDFVECGDALSLSDCVEWGTAALGHKIVLKALADNDGALLYWQYPDQAQAKAALDNCVIKQVGELLVHPDAVEVEAGNAYTMPTPCKQHRDDGRGRCIDCGKFL